MFTFEAVNQRLTLGKKKTHDQFHNHQACSYIWRRTGRGGALTSKLLVFDVEVNKPHEDHLKHLYGECFLDMDHALIPGGRHKIRPL